MADEGRELILRAKTELALPTAAAGPLAGMISDALVLVEQLELLSEKSARLSVLIADDDAPTVKYLAELLAPSFSVTVAADGFDALDRLLTVEFDVVVLNQTLRGMNAAELTLRLGQTRPEIVERIIFVSGADAISSPGSAGPGPLLRKPVRLDQWDNAILAVLRKTKGAAYRSVESVFVL